jgi:hypothetical protein
VDSATVHTVDLGHLVENRLGSGFRTHER